MSLHQQRTHPEPVDGSGDVKCCNRCGDPKPLSAFYSHPATKDGRRGECRDCTRAREATRRAGTNRNDIELASHLRRKYGITREQYDAMVAEQDGKCAICHDPPTGRFSRLCVDHNHETGAVRALLCDRCNRGLGQFKDNVDLMVQAIVYLRSHR